MSESSEKVTCPKCQAVNFTTSAVCWQCGETLPAPAETPASEQPVPLQAPVYGANLPPAATPTYEPQSQPVYAAKPQNYLVWSILTTLFCCMPAGVVSIVYAAQVDSKYATGDLVGSQNASNTARTWAWVSFGVGLVATLSYLALMIIGVVSSGQFH